jgi:hypothetical protein
VLSPWLRRVCVCVARAGGAAAEFKGLSVRALRQRARALGVDEPAIEAAVEGKNPRQATIALIKAAGGGDDAAAPAATSTEGAGRLVSTPREAAAAAAAAAGGGGSGAAAPPTAAVGGADGGCTAPRRRRRQPGAAAVGEGEGKAAHTLPAHADLVIVGGGCHAA